MEMIGWKSYRSEGRLVNQTDNRFRVTIDCTRNEFNRYFKNDQFKKLEVVDEAIEGLKLIDEFHSECFCGYPLQILGKDIDHTKLNQAYDKAFTVFKRLEKQNEI